MEEEWPYGKEPQNIPEKRSMSTVTIVLIVVGILVVVSIVGGVILAGFSFLWAGSLTDESGVDETPFMSFEIDSNTDTLIVTVTRGEAEWNEYTVRADGEVLTTGADTTWEGETAEFTSENFDPEYGMEYTVEVVRKSDDRLIAKENVMAE